MSLRFMARLSNMTNYTSKRGIFLIIVTVDNKHSKRADYRMHTQGKPPLAMIALILD